MPGPTREPERAAGVALFHNCEQGVVWLQLIDAERGVIAAAPLSLMNAKSTLAALTAEVELLEQHGHHHGRVN